MRASIRVALSLLAGAWLATPAAAHGPDAYQAYRLEYHTVLEERQVTAYRIEYETVYDEQRVTSFRPVWETEMRERRYTVAHPVYETSEREERYTVERPVWETQERLERYTVRRQVWETGEREESYTVMDPVTTFETVQVDQGCYVDHTVLRPGPVRNRLAWHPGACVVDPLTGRTTYHRGGLFWTPVQGPPRYEVQRIWQPNVVAQQVPRTTFVARVVTRKVPVQVCRYVDQEVVHRVPQQVCRLQREVVVRKVPVTSCRMVQLERVEPVPVRVCRQVAEEQTVRVPRLVEKRIPVTCTYRVPRTVVYRVPVDACGVPYGYDTIAPGGPPATYAPGATSEETEGKEPTPARPRDEADQAEEDGTGQPEEKDGATERPAIDPGQAVPEPVDESAPADQDPADEKAGRQKLKDAT